MVQIMDTFLYVFLGIIFHVLIFALVFYKKFLTWPDGTIVAGCVSFLTFLAGIRYWIILLLFFIPASIISKANQEKKKNNIIFEKSSQRNAYQVLANSFGLLFFAVLQIFSFGIDGKIDFLFLFSGTAFIASASSDTWSTEIGTLNKSDPYFILNLRKRVPKGTSGGITIVGTLGAFFGSFIIGITFLLLLVFNQLSMEIETILEVFLLIVFLGFSGSLLDSILGATLQNKYQCYVCNQIVEEKYHPTCNSSHLPKIKNLTFLDNNTVNLSSNLGITVIAFLLLTTIHFKL